MMHASVRLGTVRGIPVGLHGSWFLIFALVTWSLARGYFPPTYPDLPLAAYWLMGAATALLFFGSVFLHELGHSITAQRLGIPVKGITLFIFGGVAQIGREPDSPGAEFKIAIAGPAVSLALAVAFGIVYVLDRRVPYLAAPSEWLARINLMLAVFNLIPGFPLDGGRVLRAAVWRLTGSFQRATRAASVGGQIVAYGFMGLGVFIMFGGAFFNGLWLVFIGWFLLNAAAAGYAQASLQQALRGVTVAQVMSTDCELVRGDLSVRDLVENRILTGGRRCFYVGYADDLIGMLTLRELSGVPRERWDRTSLEQVMVPLERLVKIAPGAPLMSALQAMDDANVAQVPVIDEGGRIVGALSREQILHYVRTRVELGV